MCQRLDPYTSACRLGAEEANLEIELRRMLASVDERTANRHIRNVIEQLEQRADAYALHAFNRALKNAMGAPLPMPPRPLDEPLPTLDPEEVRLIGMDEETAPCRACP